MTLTAILAASTPLRAGDKSVVDQLEQELIKQNTDSLPYQDEAEPPIEIVPHSAPKSPSYRGSMTIKGAPQQLESLQKINADLARLQTEISQLGAKIDTLQQRVFQQTQMDNLVVLEVKVMSADTAFSDLQALVVKIDGDELYHLNDKAGLAMPQDSFEIFHGPLLAGRHRLDLTARVVRNEDGKIPLDQGNYYVVNKSFELVIPAGSLRKKWTIQISVPQQRNAQASAEIKESTLTL